MKRALLLLAAAAVAFPAAAQASPIGQSVNIGGAFYDPGTKSVLVGDTVTWSNTSERNHTVTADDGSFGSGTLHPTQTFAFKFPAAGQFKYYCKIHAFMYGEVDAYDLLLDPTSGLAAPNAPLVLTGRSALPGGTPLTVTANSGQGFAPVGSTTVGDDGTFTASVPASSGAFRVESGTVVSPAVQITVADRTVLTKVSKSHGRTTVAVHVTPAVPGGTVVLQLHLRERFGWWPMAWRKLDTRSGAIFHLRGYRHVQMRVALTLSDGATRIATSAPRRLP